MVPPISNHKLSNLRNKLNSPVPRSQLKTKTVFTLFKSEPFCLTKRVLHFPKVARWGLVSGHPTVSSSKNGLERYCQIRKSLLFGLRGRFCQIKRNRPSQSHA